MKNKQTVLFEDLKNKTGQSSKDFVISLGLLLSIGKSACYARINGTTPISFTELELIASHYNINVGNYFTSKNDITFYLPSLGGQPTHRDDFINGFQKDLEALSEQEDSSITFINAGLPMFFYFKYPSLTYFKFFTWEKSIWDLKGKEKLKFHINYYPNLFEKKLEYLNQLYLKTDSIEIWSNNFMSNILSQIKYFEYAGHFLDKHVAISLIEDLKNLVEDWKMMTKTGFKVEGGGKMSLFINEGLFTNNFVIIEGKGLNKVFVSYDNPNIMISEDKRLFSYTKDWSKKLEDKSMFISGTSEKERSHFFNELISQIKETESTLEN